MELLNVILFIISLGIVLTVFICIEKQIVKNDLKDYISDDTEEEKSNRNTTITT